MKNSKLLIVVVAIAVVALSIFSYNSTKSNAADGKMHTELEGLTEEQKAMLIEKVGQETYDKSSYTYFNYVGAHRNLFEVKEETNTTAIKVTFDYAKLGEDVVMVFQPKLEYASLLNGKIEELIDPEYDFDEGKLVITSRIKHVVESDGETFTKIDQVAVLVEL